MTRTASPWRGARIILVSALLVVSSVARGQNFSSSRIATIPRSFGGAVSEDNRWLFTLSGNGVVAVTDAVNDRYVQLIDLNGVATNPSGIAYCQGKLFIESYDNIVVVDATTRTVSRVLSQPFSVGDSMGDVGVSPDGRFVYAISGSSDCLSIIDPDLERVIATVPVGRNNVDLSISPDGSRVYLINSLTALVTMVDTASRQVFGTATFVGDRSFLNLPAASQMRSDGTLYVAWSDSAYDAQVSRLDRDGNLLGVLSENFDSTGLAFTLDERYLVLGAGYIINPDSGAVVSQISTVPGPSRVVFAPNGERAYITNSNWLHVLVVEGFQTMLTTTGSTAMGNLVTINLFAPNERGKMYQLAASTSTTHGIALLNGGLFPLDRDSLFRYTMRPQPGALTGFTGNLGSDGRATATMRLSSAIPGCAIGQTLYVAFGTFTGERRLLSDVAAVSNVVPVTIRP